LKLDPQVRSFDLTWFSFKIKCKNMIRSESKMNQSKIMHL